MVKVKICGLTTPQDIDTVNAYLPDFIGMVLFFPKSKRNLSLETASALKAALDPRISTVAVTVSPTAEAVRAVCNAGFHYLQVHGTLTPEAYDCCTIPILRAFNLSDLDSYHTYCTMDRIAGFVFDASAPGSGTTFDWTLLSDLPRSEKLWILAGGLHAGNVCDAIRCVRPDAVDVSSGVETAGTTGKDTAKVHDFIQRVRSSSTIS